MSHFLPSITDRKEINQYMNNVSLILIDLLQEDFQKLSPFGSTFIPSDLDLAGKKRKVAKEIVLAFFKKMIEVSNSDLIANANHLIRTVDV